MYQGPDPERTETPNDQRHEEVTASDLPVHCPLPEMSLWNSHQQVYIPLEKVGDEATCPYCGTLFRLVESNAGGGRGAA
ncbi:MAG: zinc-finger domain-containing protein [Gammaproteobacteria bacterium]|nr:zinc-finger domain-containing protein [Gammaproteobacteria bacterium]